jgi:MFS family permease
MASLTSVNVALPTIGADLDIDLGGQHGSCSRTHSRWRLSTWSRARSGDRLGRRKMFMLGTIGFAVASALGGLAPNAAVLMIARVLQGTGGALLTTGSLSLLRSTFGDKSGRAIGAWTTGTGVVSLAGPPLGAAVL